MSEKKILIIDGHGIAFRAFYAVPELNAPDGTPTNVLVGFFNMLARIKSEQNPDEIYAAFDMKGPTFRHLIFQDYKATRKPTPEAFKAQLPILEEMLASLGIRLMRRAGIEADDLIGSAAVQFSQRGDEVIVLTSDKDIMQIIRPHVRIIRPGKGVSSFEVYDEAFFTEKFGFAPDKMADYLALMGDTADNIPGVSGVGEKTAAKLIKEFGSVASILENTASLKPALRAKMEEFAPRAQQTLALTRLKCDEDLTEFTQTPSSCNIAAFSQRCAQLGLKKAAAAFSAKDEDARGSEALELQDDDLPALDIPPAAQIPLETILCAPRLALDLDTSHKTPCVILAAPDGSWWSGSFDELYSRWDALAEHSVACVDAKALCSLMKKPTVNGLWDIKTAWYLLHPDLESYNAEKILALPFSAERAMKLFGTSRKLKSEIESQGMSSVMETIDMPLIPALVNMQRRGIRLQSEKMTALASELNDRLSALSAQIKEAAGYEINLNSPRQVGELLFEKLALPVIKKTKTGYSTDVSVLEQLRDICGARCPIPAQLLEFRELSKMSSGFVQPLMNAAADDGLIHSTFEALTTGTGRLSSRDPNMQNLPAYSGWGARIRECLIPAHDGNCFVAADYSQIELRVLAHLSGDPRLIEIFRSDRDIHTETAAMIFGIPADAVTKELRRSAKTVSFGLIYGMSVFGLAARLGTDRTRAAEIMDAYFAALPGVREYIESSKRQSQNEGYSSTLFGRRRPMDEISTGQAGNKAHQNRAAINSPIQGTAADITKIAMNKVTEHFAGRNVHMVLQVHDSIVCECPQSEAESVARELSQTMENAVSLSVPLKTEQSTGKTLATV